MSTPHEKRSISLSAFSVLLVITALLTFTEYTTAQSGTGALETECVALASASSTIIPSGLTAAEFCKVLVALVGNEWDKAAKLEATIIVVNDHDVRLIAAEATIVQLQADVAALQAQIFLQPQIDAINTKLANMAAALQ